MCDRESESRAYVPWSKLWLDLALIAVGGVAMIVSLFVDLHFSGHHNLFARSGSIAVLASAIVAFRSLSKHYEKVFLYPTRQKILRTSRNQKIVDSMTLVLSIIGTLAWGYADLIVGA